MKQVTLFTFIKMICQDFGIEQSTKDIVKFEQYPIVQGKRRISSSYHSVIVDREGNEFPYMLDYNNRNNEKLKDFDHIYTTRSKSLQEIQEETNIEIPSTKCKICDGNGWYSYGQTYTYKDIYCEVQNK